MNDVVASKKAHCCSAACLNKTIKSKRIWKTLVITLCIVIHDDDDNDLTHFNLKKETWPLLLKSLTG